MISAEHDNVVSRQLHEFSTYQHHSARQLPCGTCYPCAKELILSAKSTVETVNAAAQLSIFIVESALTNSDEQIRELSQRVAFVLQKAIEVRIHPFQSFARHSCLSSNEYEDAHR